MNHRSVARLLWVIFGGALVTGCSLSGLIFDRTDPEDASSSGGTTAGSGASKACVPDVGGSMEPRGSGESNCTNNRDDDDDGLIDCEDPDCTLAGFSCINEPQDWEGPGVFYKGSPQSLPCCPSEYPNIPVSGGEDPIGEPATCGACSCVTDFSCQPGALDLYELGFCFSPSVPLLQDEACHALTMATKGAITAAEPIVTKNPACTAMGGGVSNMPTRSWTTVAQFCGGMKAHRGCDGARTCARHSPAFGNSVCFWHEGLLDCPAEFPKKQTFFSDVNDSRGCTDCQCGAPDSGGSCSVTTVLYSAPDCSEASKLNALPNPTSCTGVDGVQAYSMLVNFAPPSCPATQATPAGSIAPRQGSEITVCCSQ